MYDSFKVKYLLSYLRKKTEKPPWIEKEVISTVYTSSFMDKII